MVLILGVKDVMSLLYTPKKIVVCKYMLYSLFWRGAQGQGPASKSDEN